MTVDVAQWSVSYLTKVLNDVAWTLEQLTDDMKSASAWGNERELSRMIDLGIAIGWDLDEIYAQIIGKPARAGLSGVKEPASFDECIELMRAKVRVFQAKMDEHLEALKNASEEQKQQENFLMRRLQEALALSLRNIRTKCKRSWPGRWSEAQDEEFEDFIKIH